MFGHFLTEVCIFYLYKTHILFPLLFIFTLSSASFYLYLPYFVCHIYFLAILSCTVLDIPLKDSLMGFEFDIVWESLSLSREV